MTVLKIHPDSDPNLILGTGFFVDTCSLIMTLAKGSPEEKFMSEFLVVNRNWLYIAPSHTLEYPHVLRRLYYNEEASSFHIPYTNRSVKEVASDVLAKDSSAEARVCQNVKMQLQKIKSLVKVPKIDLTLDHSIEIAQHQMDFVMMESNDVSCYLTMKQFGANVILSQDQGFHNTDLDIIVLDKKAPKLTKTIEFI